MVWSILLSALIYLPALNAPLIWDDRDAIVFNDALEKPVSPRIYFSADYFPFSRELTWRPLATLSYQSLIALAGKSPAVLRGLSLLLHVANGLLLLFLLRGYGVAPPAAAWAAALFIIHAAHAETLMCVAFNEELLAGLGLLLFLTAHQKKRIFLAVTGLSLALLSKETGVLGVVLALVHDGLASDGRLKKMRGAHLTYAAAAFLYMMVRFFLLPGPGAAEGLSHLLPWTERFYYALSGTADVFRVFWLPWRLKIEYFALPPGSALDWAAGLTGFAAVAAIFFFGLRHLLKKDRTAFFLLLWPLPFLALTSNLLPINVLSTRLWAERWFYLPALGAISVLAITLYSPRRKFALPILLILWSLLAGLRVQDWTGEDRLWLSLLRVYPWSAKAEEGLGTAYFRSHRYPLALKSFLRAQALRDGRQDLVLARYVPLSQGKTLRWESPSLKRWLGLTYHKLDDQKKTAELMAQAAELEPSHPLPYRVLAYRCARAGDFSEARRWLEMGLRFSPDDPILRMLESSIQRRRLAFAIEFN